MKAIVCRKYGPPSGLRLEEVPRPTPKAGELLISVRATAVNDYDWSMVRGQPRIYRLLFGLLKPKRPIPGMELAGTVEAIGQGVTAFQVGDAVYGDTSDHTFGTFAEYIAVNQAAVAPMPEGMRFVEATTLPHAALLAYQGLVELGQIKNGQRVLINGAGGGVGTIGLQLAKLYDAEVTGVDTGSKLDMMKEIGFDHVIDYKQTDFTTTGEQYDLILDAKTTRPPKAYTRALREGGTYVTVGGELWRLLQIVLGKKRIYRRTQKQLQVLALKANKGLDVVGELFVDGKIKPVIDGPYPLSEAPQAIERFGAAEHGGKVVVEILH